MIKTGDRRGRQFIIVDEWGPYDWKSPKLWPAGRSDELPLKLRVLGPEGEWKMASVRGANVSSPSGKVPGEIVVTPSSSGPVDFDVTLEYRGGPVTSPRGDSETAPNWRDGQTAEPDSPAPLMKIGHRDEFYGD